MPTFKLYTLGCKVNQYDSQDIRERFSRLGLKELNNGKAADIYIINTCTVTHRADADSLRYVRRAMEESPNAKIVVTGCLAGLDRAKIRKIHKHCLIVKNRDKKNILKLLFNADSRAYELTNLRANKGVSYFAGHTRAFLKIQDGCDNFCSYCKVPLVRGRSRSRPPGEIVAEAQRLVKNGFKEIVLCGICLGSYRYKSGKPMDLVDVIAAMEKIDGLLRIRLSSIEAADVTGRLINKMARSKKLCRHLHIPIQSGDNEILKMMRRKYSREDYLKLIARIRRRLPLIAITTDVLVGFPGESEGNFQNTLDLIRRIEPLKVHIFPYSERRGTLAAEKFKELINPQIIRERTHRLESVAGECAIKYKQRFLHKTLRVLVETRSKDRVGYWEGYAENYIKVFVKTAENLKNAIITTRHFPPKVFCEGL